VREHQGRRILKLVRGFLTAGVLIDGLVGPTEEGTPQGGPLSPPYAALLATKKKVAKLRFCFRWMQYCIAPFWYVWRWW
jgi:retron-type reverse transcriptase